VTAYGATAIQAKAKADPVNLVVNLFSRYTPAVIVNAMHILLLGSAFAALLALHNVANRYFYSLGREHLLPGMLGVTHSKHRSPWLAGLTQSVLAALFIGLTLLFGVDPYLGLLLWGSALGLVGIIFLWALCSAAIFVYMRGRRCSEGLWQTKVAPLVAFLALTCVLMLAFDNVSFLTGATALVNNLLIGGGVLAFVFGIVGALRMRIRHPVRYERLAQGGRVDPA
jgi:amino acid transporter